MSLDHEMEVDNNRIFFINSNIKLYNDNRNKTTSNNGKYSRTNGNGRTGTRTLNTYTQYYADSPISRFNSASLPPTN